MVSKQVNSMVSVHPSGQCCALIRCVLGTREHFLLLLCWGIVKTLLEMVLKKLLGSLPAVTSWLWSVQ